MLRHAAVCYKDTELPDPVVTFDAVADISPVGDLVVVSGSGDPDGISAAASSSACAFAVPSPYR